MKSATSTEFRVGERVPGTDWVMRRVLGQGGHGIVFEVRKGPHLRKAMKVLQPALVRNPHFEARFAEEVQVLARVHHPNIVDVADCGVLADGSPFLLMELLQGRTLREVVHRMPIPFTARAVRQIVSQICAGLGHAHGHEPPVIHRDVKPDNIFLHAPRHVEAQIKLLDFGIAEVLDASPSPESPVGTLRYAAPEVLDHQPIRAKADLYALAVVVYELLTQGFPWRVDVGSLDRMKLIEAHRHLEPLAPSRWKTWIPNSVDACLLRALSKDPADRQRSVAEFYDELADLEFVNDGSARFRKDAPTPFTVDTMARGRLAPVTEFGREADPHVRGRRAQKAAWLDAARSRLRDTRVSIGTSGVSTNDRQDRRPHRAKPDQERAAPASDRGGRVDTPVTGDMPLRTHRRGRVPPAALVLGAGALVAAVTWGGWKIRHSAPAIESASPVGPPPALSLAWARAADPVAAPEVRREGNPESPALDAGGSVSHPPAIPAGAEGSIGQSPPAPPPRRTPRRPAPAPTNLARLVAGAPPGVPSQTKPSPPAPVPTNLDDIVLAGPPPELAGDRKAPVKRVIIVDMP